MPLTTCPDCKKEVSDQAPACPGCGRPMLNSMAVGTEKAIELTSKRFKKISLIAFGLFLVGFIIMISNMVADAEANALSAASGPLMLAGIIIYVVNRVRIWWHHK